ncbi:MAG: KH domain-containing protein, partial [Oscillospiraceae bacterium]|nr:KH domain-containing protein [Oscillospiraceae bacterium]
MFNDNDVKIEEMDLNGEFTGKSIEEAKDKAAAQFGVSVTEIYFQIVNDVKKGLFGKVKEEAKVLAGYNRPTEDDTAEAAAVTSETETKAAQTSDSEISEEQIACVKKYLENIIEKMGIDAGVTVEVREGVFYVDIDSKGSGAVIGRRGETLDAIQYLASMTANRGDKEYYRITVDCCGYREKRKAILEELAAKIAKTVIRTGRTSTLEPMNPYERRIIR